jgi:hypothetical protein
VEVCNEEKTGFVVSELCKAGCLTTVTGPVCALCNEGLVQCNSDEDGEWVEECVDPLASFQVKEVCTALQSCAGGSCLNVLPLSGTASAEDNYLLLSLAFVDCWLGATEGLCRSIDTTELDYSISYDQLRTWFCDNKEDTDFPASFETTAQFEAAADIYGNCSTFEFPQEEDLDFEIDAIAPGEFGLDCMGYSTAFGLANLNSKEVVVKPCGSF